MLSLPVLRRLALAGSGLTFATIALLTTVAPITVAGFYGLTPNGVDGLSEVRAVFTGFWLALAAAMLTAARRPEQTMLGDVCGLMILLQALARVSSLVLDGRPSLPFIGAMLGELVTAALILAPRVAEKRAASAD
jgi:hypothetical protein